MDFTPDYSDIAVKTHYTKDLESGKIVPLYVDQYTVLDWNPKWGCFTVTLNNTTISKEFIVTKDGCLLKKGVANKEGNRLYPKSGGYYYDGICAYPFCIEKLEEGEKYCKRHTCYHENCDEPVWDHRVMCKKHMIKKEELEKKKILCSHMHQRKASRWFMKRKCWTVTIMNPKKLSWTNGMDLCRMAAMQKIIGQIGKK